jgi:hypothetical protein
VKKLQSDKLTPKSDKCIFVGYPKETLRYYFYNRSEGKVFVARNGVFLEKEFLKGEKCVYRLQPTFHIPLINQTDNKMLEVWCLSHN